MSNLKYPFAFLAAAFALLTIVGGCYESMPTRAVSPYTLNYISKARLPFTLAGRATGVKDSVFSCQSSDAPSHCYAPRQIRAAYNIQSLLNSGITGKKRTIVIIDAFQSPTIRHDLQLFDRTFGLNDPTLNIVAPNGLPRFNPNDSNQVGWAGEITLDVEWAHAVAPAATITLVLARSNTDIDILNATKYAVDHNLGDVISQSFGEAENCVDSRLLRTEHAIFQNASKKGISLFASSGDNGAAQPACSGSSMIRKVSSPAGDPLVTGVGGTQLTADYTTGAYNNEIAWNETGQDGGASGGGFSGIYRVPNYQVGTPTISRWRGVPDIAYDGAVDGGVLAVWSSSGWGNDLVFVFGGTSAGSPQWAGIAALADQLAGKRLGFLNKALYSIARSSSYSASLQDISSGDNSIGSITGYQAGSGWDAVTGWGSPNVAYLAPLLIRTCHSNDAAGL